VFLGCSFSPTAQNHTPKPPPPARLTLGVNFTVLKIDDNKLSGRFYVKQNIRNLRTDLHRKSRRLELFVTHDDNRGTSN